MKKLLSALILSTMLCSCGSLDNTQCSCDCCHCSDTVESISEESLFLPPSLTYEQLLENIKQAYIDKLSITGEDIFYIYNIRYMGCNHEFTSYITYTYVCDVITYIRDTDYMRSFRFNFNYSYLDYIGGSN